MVKIALIKIIRIYQKISKSNIRVCKYYPTCSAYGIQALEKYGAIKGIYLTLYRILRCNPFSNGGYDPVK